jgi:Putative Flp pilus-assembly TadE/G-like
MRTDRIHAQRGMTLLVVCLLLIAFLGVAALCIDLGVLYTARTSAQHAADAAALAGAFTFLNPGAVQPDAAQQAAIAVAATNKIVGQSVSIAAGDVAVDTAARRVTVTVSRLGAGGVGIFFGKALGMPRVSVQAQAMAQASVAASATRCIKPIYVPNTVLSPLSPAQACAANQILFDSNHNLTAWGQSQLGLCGLIRPTNPADAKKGLSPGQFYSLDFGSGANTYRCTWSSCLNGGCGASQSVIACNNSYPVKTGDMVGPTNQGVGDLVGNNPDTWVAPGIYENSGGTLTDTSHQLSLVPVWDNCNFPIGSGSTQSATVIGFLEMFVDGMSNSCTGNTGGGSWVRIHTVTATGCGSDGGGGGTQTGPFAVPVQLVKH